MKPDDKRLKNLRHFKKGQSGNPEGGRAHNPELRRIKRVTQAEVAEIGSLIVGKDLNALKQIVADAKSGAKKHSALKLWMATVAIKGITSGDSHRLNALLDRVVGKVKEKIELTGHGDGPIRSITTTMTKEERLLEIKRLAKARKECDDD